MVVVKQLLTPTDFVRMIERGELDEDAWCELVDGEVICLQSPPWYHASVVMAVALTLGNFAREIGALLLSESAGFIVGDKHQQVRQPDLSLVSKERLRILPAGQRLATDAPDLAVEVLSGDQHTEAYAKRKVAEYFAAGSRVVWLVDSDSRTVRVYEAGRAEYSAYSGEAQVNLEAIAPGFSVSIASFFP